MEALKLNTLQTPWVDFQTQWAITHKWKKAYNRQIELKRIEALQKGIEVKGLEEYQKLREVHFQLMLELTRQAISQLCNKSEVTLCYPNQYFVLRTTYRKLKNFVGAGCVRTIKNQLTRLQTAGVIVQRINHGNRDAFELFITPHFMAVFDASNPDFKPENAILQKLENQSPKGVGWKKFQDIKEDIEKGSITKQLRTERNASLNEITGKPEKSINKKGHKELSSFQKACQALISGLSEDERKKIVQKLGAENLRVVHHDPLPQVQYAPEIKEKLAEKQREKDIIAALKNRKKGIHPKANDNKTINLLQYLQAEVPLFVEWAFDILYPDRTIFPELMPKTAIYLIDNYFKGCDNISDIDSRLTQMRNVILLHGEKVALNPERYNLYPLQYFDLKRRPRHEKDYSGFLGGVRLLQHRKKDAKQKIQIRQRRNYRAQLKRFMNEPTLYGYNKMLVWIQKNCQEMHTHFLQQASKLTFKN